MDVKLFELRDRATCMSIMAVRLRNRTPREYAILRRAGYSANMIGGPEDNEPYVVLVQLEDIKAQYDPFAWSGSMRTMPTAHRYIIEHWNELSTGDLVDVRTILGETSEPALTDLIGYDQ